MKVRRSMMVATVVAALISVGIGLRAAAVSPVVTLTSPAVNSTVPAGGVVNIEANVIPGDVPVVYAEFIVTQMTGRFPKYILDCFDYTPPYSCSWAVDSAPGKTYFVQAQVVDANDVITPVYTSPSSTLAGNPAQNAAAGYVKSAK